MQTHTMEIIIPEDHRLVVDVPETFRSGPAQLILVAPTTGDTEAVPSAEALARWDATVAQLARDGRPFHLLSPEEKRERHRLLRGIGRGLLPSSEQLARAKREEVELEERKLGR